MADENELRDLCERIGRLSMDDRLHLLEMVLADARAARAREDEEGRRELAFWEERQLKRQRSAVPVEDHSREAG
jgi:hypothetical protein